METGRVEEISIWDKESDQPADVVLTVTMRTMAEQTDWLYSLPR